VSAYHEIEGYPDRGIERNLPELGIDPDRAVFTETLLPVEKIGWYRRPNHAAQCSGRVSEIVSAYLNGIPVPPIICVAMDNGNYTVPDGYHRLHAARELGMPLVRCYVVEGEQ
jgi:hypothetical protein